MLPGDDGPPSDAVRRQANVVEIKTCYFEVHGYREVCSLGFSQTYNQRPLLRHHTSNDVVSSLAIEAPRVPAK